MIYIIVDHGFYRSGCRNPERFFYKKNPNFSLKNSHKIFYKILTNNGLPTPDFSLSLIFLFEHPRQPCPDLAIATRKRPRNMILRKKAL